MTICAVETLDPENYSQKTLTRLAPPRDRSKGRAHDKQLRRHRGYGLSGAFAAKGVSLAFRSADCAVPRTGFEPIQLNVSGNA
jgi:hypothetical protein